MSNPVKPNDEEIAWAKAEPLPLDDTANHPLPSAPPMDEESLVGTGPPLSSATPLMATTTTTTIIMDNQSLGRYPCVIECPYCHQVAPTRTRDVMGCFGLVAVLILAFVCCPLFWVPFCCLGCKTTEHYCRSCRRRIGSVDPCSNG
jgi:lipopolysaccharide-induced tumor necrosis factor-alpha factor